MDHGGTITNLFLTFTFAGSAFFFTFISEHAQVFDFLFSDGGTVVSNEDELSFSLSDASFGRSVTENGLTTFEDKGKFLIDGL